MYLTVNLFTNIIKIKCKLPEQELRFIMVQIKQLIIHTTEQWQELG